MKPLKLLLLSFVGLHAGLATVLAETPQLIPVLNSVFRIFYGGVNGAAFTIEVDGRQYLITAKHVVAGIKTGEEITLVKKEQTAQKIPVVPLECEDTNVDIMVLVPSEQVAPALGLIPTAAASVLGQDVFLFGFPLGYYSSMNESIVPFVGKGTLSASDTRNASAPKFFIHATAVRGFSGGPIVFVEERTKQLRILGVISGFETEKYPVLNGQFMTGMESAANPGIMFGYGIDVAVAMIRKKPFGPVVR